LTDYDEEDVTKKIETVGNLENPNVKLNFVVNISARAVRDCLVFSEYCLPEVFLQPFDIG
jgi:hypothetical protein